MRPFPLILLIIIFSIIEGFVTTWHCVAEKIKDDAIRKNNNSLNMGRQIQNLYESQRKILNQKGYGGYGPLVNTFNRRQNAPADLNPRTAKKAYNSLLNINLGLRPNLDGVKPLIDISLPLFPLFGKPKPFSRPQGPNIILPIQSIANGLIQSINSFRQSGNSPVSNRPSVNNKISTPPVPDSTMSIFEVTKRTEEDKNSNLFQILEKVENASINAEKKLESLGTGKVPLVLFVNDDDEDGPTEETDIEVASDETVQELEQQE